MKARGFDPQRLDVAALARAGSSLEARWPWAAMDRLAAAAHPEAQAPGEVSATVRGERIERLGDEPRHVLHLRAELTLPLVCQRCLGPVDCDLVVDRPIVFVEGEERAAALDAEMDDDVLALAPALDLRELVEDELLLALPLVPRHELCPNPLPLAEAAAPAVEEERQRPFANLRALRGGSGGAEPS